MGIHNHPLTSLTTRRFVMAHHSEGSKQLYYDKPIGHYGGNDFTLLWLDSTYRVPGRYHFGVTAFWEGNGSVPQTELLESKINKDLRPDPIDEDEATMAAPSSGYVTWDGEEWVAMWTTAVTLHGEFYPRGIGRFNAPASGSVPGPPGPGASPGRTLSIGSELTAQWTKNRFNLPSPWAFDLQWVVSTTITY